MPDQLEPFYVENAGLVLLAPFLPKLWEVFELTTDGAFNESSSRDRAVSVLQHCATGDYEFSESEVPLNKILCGIDPSTAITQGSKLSELERRLVHSMLTAVIERWSALGTTSVEGFQESFLQRSGHVRLDDSQWWLQVDGRGYDMLLDSIPWDYDLIQLAWMNRPIKVAWR